ncbi:M3 family oligoendopeptidase [bacterium]|nr:M3 family oligoendopeptidase [candidate division CSSED10-310 bacterium]
MTSPEPESMRLENRYYVPLKIDLCDWKQVKPLFDDLLDREIRSSADLEQLILDMSGLNGALEEEHARIQLATSINTADEAARNRFKRFQETIISHAGPRSNNLERKILDNPHLKDLNLDRYGQFIKLLKNQQRLFTDSNVPLAIEDAQLGETYSSIVGGMVAEFEGKTRNMTQIAQFLKETERDLREKAWHTMRKCRMAERDRIDDIYSRMVEMRHRMAENAGYPNFRDFRHLQYSRFDYAPEDCIRFHETIEKHVTPVWLDRIERRRQKLGIEKLRPWDMNVDPEGNQPLRPFKTTGELIETTAAVLDRIHVRLGDHLRLLDRYGNLDLATRANKMPVGFNMPMSETGVSFIFMNATGTHYDFMVLLHESGHAIETRSCAHNPVHAYRNTPQEWGECASQSMELLGLDHLDILYEDPETRRRCKIEKWEELLFSLVSTARNDAFQHWIYENPGHSPRQRHDRWMELLRRFPSGADSTGYEDSLEIAWQSIPHLFIVPFYYIEYGIAQIAALQVFKRAREEGQPAVKRWLDAMKLGYSRSIPELYRAAGLTFRFHGQLAEGLIRYAVNEIERIESE